MAPPSRAVASTRQALRAAIKLDASLVVPWAGAITALPVFALFAFGLIVSTPATASGLALGALFVGLAARINGPRLPISTMGADAVGLALSALIAAACSPYPWLHFASLVLWCFAGGLLVALGPERSVVGIQGVMAIIIFGRAPQTIHQATVLALLVLAGGCIQTLVQMVARLPFGLRLQRQSVAEIYRQLSQFAGAEGASRSRSVAEAVDRALATMRSSALYGRSDAQALRGLIDEARRMRLELIALESLAGHLARGPEVTLLAAELRLQCQRAMMAIAQSLNPDIGGDGSSDETSADWLGVDVALAHMQEVFDATKEDSGLAGPLATHVTALAGQLRAAAKLVDRATDRSSPRLVPHRRFSHHSWSEATRAAAHALVDNITFTSPALRHAIRLAVVVPVVDLFVVHSSLPHAYWIPLTAAVVLRPDFGATLTRGIARLGGSLLGVGLIGVVLAGLHPSEVVTAVLVALTAWLTYTFYQSNYAVGVCFLTGLVLLLISVGQTDSWGTAGYRLLDTLIGGSVALVAYVAWPTWSKQEALHSLANLVMAQRRYVAAVLATLSGHDALDVDDLSRRGRTARLAFTAAEAAVGRSLSEPTSKRVDPEESRSVIAGLRRIIRAAHGLRTELNGDETALAPIELGRFATDVDQSLVLIATGLEEDGVVSTIPPLRRRYADVQTALGDAVQEQHILMQMDELVDAINTVAHVLSGDDAGEASG